MHVAQLRRELDDKLFTRTASGLAFTPGGLRLASRAVEILGLQDRTVREVSQAGHGRRLLRIASSSLFAEHAAPRLIDLFAGRAADLDVELSVRPTAQFPGLLAAGLSTSRSADCRHLPEGLVLKPFLNYEVLAVAGPDHPFAGGTVDLPQARCQNWMLGPSAVGARRCCRGCCASSASPSSQRIFQSDAAALEETKRTDGIALALRFAVAGDLAAGRLAAVAGPGMRARGSWAAMALPPHSRPPRPRSCCASSPPPAPPRRWCVAPVQRRPLQALRARHTLELAASRSSAVQHSAQRVGRQELVAERQRRRHRPDQWFEAGGGGSRVEPDQPVDASCTAPAPRAAAPAPRCPSRRTPPRGLRRAACCRAGSAAGRPGSTPDACRRTGPRRRRGLRDRDLADRWRSAGVSRVSAVENANVSARPVRAKARIRCR